MTKIYLLLVLNLLILYLITGCAGYQPGSSNSQNSSSQSSTNSSTNAVTVNISSNASPGYIFCCTMLTNPSYMLVLDNSGTVNFSKKMTPGSAYDFKVQKDGVLSYYDNNTHQFVLLDNSFNQTRSFGCIGYTIPDLHELRALSNGNYIYLIYADRTNVDLSGLGGSASGTVIDAVIQEQDPSGNVVFEWSSSNHIALTDSLVSNYSPKFDYVHANAIDIDFDGNILLSSRHLSQILKIRRITNEGGTMGEIMWRLGGVNAKESDFTFSGDTLNGFSYQHCARRLPNSNIILFDNGNDHTPSQSRAVEYKLDESAMTASLEWEYRSIPSTYSFAMGSVQRLTNGNTLIGWGFNLTNGIREVQPDGTVVLDMSFPNGVVSYRAFRFEKTGGIWRGDPYSPAR
jgi:hypothetical protein